MPTVADPEPSQSAGSSDESSEFDSSSKSGKSSVKKRLEKEKLKRILALKNELLRRQSHTEMNKDEQATFLKEKS